MRKNHAAAEPPSLPPPPSHAPPIALGCALMSGAAVVVVGAALWMMAALIRPPVGDMAPMAAMASPAWTTDEGADRRIAAGAMLLFRRPVAFDGERGCAALGAIERGRRVLRVRRGDDGWVVADVEGSGSVWLLNPIIDKGAFAEPTVAYRMPQDAAVCDIVGVLDRGAVYAAMDGADAPPNWRLVETHGVQAWMYEPSPPSQ